MGLRTAATRRGKRPPAAQSPPNSYHSRTLLTASARIHWLTAALGPFLRILGGKRYANALGKNSRLQSVKAVWCGRYTQWRSRADDVAGTADRPRRVRASRQRAVGRHACVV